MTLQELAARGNWIVVDKTIYGVHQGFPFTLGLNTKKSSDALTMLFKTGSTVPLKVVKEIRTNLPKRTMVAQPNGGLQIIAASNESCDAYMLAMQVLSAATAAFRNAKTPIEPPKNCPVCKQAGCDSAAEINGKYVPVHRACVRIHAEKGKSEANNNEVSGSYLFGILGAFLGVLVGCVPVFLLGILAKIEVGFLFILIPFASYYGYKFFKGRLGNVARISVILCSLLGFVELQLLLNYYFLRAEGYMVSFALATKSYFANDFAALLDSTWFGLVFLAIGILYSFKMLGTTNRDRIKQTENSLQTVIPLSAPAATQNSLDN
ncbi:MAG: hypothetical protein LBM28_06690 [Oscillospiraceae bacterium]|jgi:hypothetical protein|nr:hypothetical protein [Oscillospiraceae bacterium]